MKLLEVEQYCFESGGRWLCPTRYWNTSGFAGAVVASLNFGSDGELFDWAAYVGGCDLTLHEEDAEIWVARHGSKVSRRDARYFFPGLPPELYRP